MRDFVRETGSQMGRDVTSLGEYLFEEKGQTPLSLGQIREVQELEARRPDLAKTGAIRASAKKILKNALANKTEVSPEKLAKSIALDLRPEEEVGRELAAEYAMEDNIDPTRPITPISDDPSIGRKIDPYGTGVLGEFGNSRKEAVSEEDKLTELRKQIQAGMSMADQPTAAPTAAPKSQKSVEEDIIVDQDKGAGLGTTRTQAAFNQQAEMISEISPTKNSFINKFKDKYSEDLAKFDSILDERKGKKASAAERRKANLEKDKYLALAQVGLNILSQDGGQTFLQALGKGSKNVIPTLMKLNREELEIAENLDDLDFETAKEKLGFSKAQYDKYVKDRMLNFEARKVKADEAKVGATIGSGLTLGEVGSYVSAFTTLPAQAIEKDKFIAFVDQQVRRDALIGLTPIQRADDSTVKESMRRLLNDAKYMGRISNNFTKQTGESLTQPMGGAPAGKPPNSSSVLNTLSSQRKNP
jgi:hypothetical protein